MELHFFCKSCGHRVSDQAIMCPKCGDADCIYTNKSNAFQAEWEKKVGITKEKIQSYFVFLSIILFFIGWLSNHSEEFFYKRFHFILPLVLVYILYTYIKLYSLYEYYENNKDIWAKRGYLDTYSKMNKNDLTKASSKETSQLKFIKFVMEFFGMK